MKKKANNPKSFAGMLINELTDTEFKVLKMVSGFMTSKEIASKIGLNYRTVENHRTNIKRKLNITGQQSLTKYAVINKDILNF